MAAPILCSVAGCNKQSIAKGLCKSHYERKRRHGDSLAGRFTRETCSIEGCDGSHASKGLCRKHYARLLRHGDPLFEFETTPPGEAIAWLRAHVEHADSESCLLWPFGIRRGGYGHMRVNGKYLGAHRVMCAHAHGEPVDGRNDVAHSCGNRLCVNPHHLRWATRSENEADKLQHGTHNRGERHGMAKLSAAEVLEIRSLRGQMLQKEIAEKFQVSKTTVAMIQARKAWKWL